MRTLTVKTYTNSSYVEAELPLAVDPFTAINQLEGAARETSEAIKDLEDFVGKSVTFEISPTTLEKTVTECEGGLTYDVTVTAKVGENVMDFCGFTLEATIEDTIVDADSTPTIDKANPSMVNGVATIKVTIPEDGTYVAGEKVTVSIADFTAPDGRTITGGTSVLTVEADPVENGGGEGGGE